MKTLLLIISLSNLGIASDVRSYFAYIRPAVQYPENVDDKLYYATFQSESYYHRKKVHPIERCVLVHGHGVHARHIALLNQEGRPILRALKQLVSPVESFAKVMYGTTLMRRLTDEVCDEVIVLFRESIQTSIAEMTLQTEAFLRDVGCTKSQRSCALFGHSKGGAVVTSIARRCTEKVASDQASCERLVAVYSSGGITVGATAPALLLGAKLFGEQADFADAFELGLHLLLKQARNLAKIDTLGDHIAGRTNPVWWDLSPLSLIDGDEAIATAHHQTIIDHRGWFRGRYSAAAGVVDYTQSTGIGFGTLERNGIHFALQSEIFTRFGRLVDNLHTPRMKRYFDRGMTEFSMMSPQIDWQELTWERFQQSDGLVEVDTALHVCENTRRAQSPAAGTCSAFKNIHHLAMSGAASEVANDVIREWLVGR
jgi:hypothetical protein